MRCSSAGFEPFYSARCAISATLRSKERGAYAVFLLAERCTPPYLLKKTKSETLLETIMSTAPEEAHADGVRETAALPQDFTWQSADGLQLHGRNWIAGATDGDTRVPVVCLPGLSRNSRDFNDIARYLHTLNHHVIALDYRGRGKSDWDTDWRNYALPVEENDIALAIEKLGLKRFAVLGTSRGGLHALV
ncbi:MAG: alpha/beta fold hydrolase, partial [Pseudomonadota bacterium]